jgi:hypothetical protein
MQMKIRGDREERGGTADSLILNQQQNIFLETMTQVIVCKDLFT